MLKVGLIFSQAVGCAMAVLSLGTIVEFTTATYAGSQVQEVVTHWIVSAVTGGGTTEAIGYPAWDTAMSTLLKALMSTAATYYGTKGRIIRPVATTVPVVSTGNSGPGFIGAQLLPSQVRGILKLLTLVIGKTGRGRMYLPWPDVADSTGTPAHPGVGYGAAQAALGTFMTSAITLGGGGATSNLFPGVYNRATHILTPYNSYEAEGVWATQRRGGPFGRPNVIPPF